MTRPTASKAIALTFALTSTSEVLMAAEYSSGGSNPISTSSGLSSNGSMNGRNDAPMPMTTSSSGAGRSNRLATALTTVTVAISARIQMAICIR